MKSLFFIVLFLVSILSFSQDLKLGIVVTPHISWLSSEDRISEREGVRVGFGFGMAGNYYFSEHYAFSFGINLNNFTGGKLRYTEAVKFEADDSVFDMDPKTEVLYKLQYLEIPLGFKLNTNKIGYFSYFGQFGFAPGFILNARGKSTNSYFENVKINNEVAMFNLPYFIGAGAEYYLGGSEKSSAITFGVIYKKGINDLTKTDTDRKSDKVLLNNVVLQLGLIF